MKNMKDTFTDTKARADELFTGTKIDEVVVVLLMMIFESLEDSRDQLYRIEQELIQIRGNQR